MPLIPFPNIPALPGVPALPAIPGAVNAALSALGLNTTSQVMTDSASVKVTPAWQINDTLGIPVLIPDSITSFEYRNEQKIPNYPVEQGGFASYNKVSTPFDVRMTCTCNGSTNMTRNAFLSAIGTLLTGLNLCMIVTPDVTYGPCNLVHFDYRRESRHGVSMVTAQLWFQEIRQARGAISATASPDTCTPLNMGQITPVSPTAGQSAMFSTPSATMGFISSSSTFAGLSSSIPAVLSALTPLTGGPKAALQISSMAAISGNLTRLVNNGSPISSGVFSSVPSQINNLAGALYAGTGGNASAVAAISAVANSALVASDVIKVSQASIR